jgi:hypothetical protein
MAIKPADQHPGREGDRRASDAPNRRRLLGWVLGGAVAAGAGLRGGAMASGADAQAAPSVVGSWLVSVPQPDGNIHVAAQSFTADGGTVTQFTSAQEEMGVSVGAGVWQATGERTFVMSFRAPLYDPRTGVTVGVAMAAGSFTLDPSGDEWSGPAQISFFAADGTLQNRTPEITIRATRVTLER